MTTGGSYLEALAGLWSEALTDVARKDWRFARTELTRRQWRSRSHIEQDSLRVVIATLCQKFGDLNGAEVALRGLSSAKEPQFLRHVITSRLLSQRGNFHGSYEIHESLVGMLGGRQRLAEPNSYLASLIGSTTSIMWRAALTSAATGDMGLSKTWFDAHEECVADAHSSQLANNSVFRGVTLLLGENPPLQAVHDANRIALAGYLRDGLSASGVLYLSTAKSVATPMIVESVLLNQYKQVHDALVQAMLVRRLLQYERISPRSEGIAEVHHVLRRLPESLSIEVALRSPKREGEFVSWLTDRVSGDQRLVAATQEEAESRFDSFLDALDYRELFIVDDIFPSVSRDVPKKTVYYLWAGDHAAGLRIRSFLVENLQLRVLGFGSPEMQPAGEDRVGRASIVDDLSQCDAAVAHLHTRQAYHLGVIRAAFPSSRVVWLSTEASGHWSDISAISIDERDPRAAFHRVRSALAAAWRTRLMVGKR